MDGPGGGKENPQLTKVQRVEAMIELTGRYRDLREIPEEELTPIGYGRKIMEDGTVRLLPLEKILELTQKDPNWEKPLKERELPFGYISVELPTSGQNFRFIPRSQKELITSRLEEVEYAFYPNWDDGASILRGPDLEIEYHIDARLQNLSTFAMEFITYLEKVGIGGHSVDRFQAENLLVTPLPQRRDDEGYDPDDPNDFEKREFWIKYSEEDDSVSSADSKAMYQELTRLCSYFADVEELTSKFQEKLDSPVSITSKRQERMENEIKQDPTIQDKYGKNYLAYMESCRKMEEYLRSKGVNTRADAIRYLLPSYLRYVGLPQTAEAIAISQSLHLITPALRDLDNLDPSVTEERELRKTIKSATPEERNILSKRLKEIEDAKKRRKQIREGVIDYFSSPQVYAEICRRKVKEVQNFLVAAGSKTGKAIFYLDATPDPALDKDPGLVSGDCTAGKPLPFDKADIPAYNVKVLNEVKQHVGNIYILVTRTKTHPHKKIWHFDAVQTPISGIEWKQGIGSIVEAVAQQGEAKGVNGITANGEIHHISNYDYIAKATEAYWSAHGRQTTEVEIPDIHDKSYSSFQGNGKAIVLWSKEKISDAYEGELESNEALFNQNEGA